MFETDPPLIAMPESQTSSALLDAPTLTPVPTGEDPRVTAQKIQLFGDISKGLIGAGGALGAALINQSQARTPGAFQPMQFFQTQPTAAVAPASSIPWGWIGLGLLALGGLYVATRK